MSGVADSFAGRLSYPLALGAALALATALALAVPSADPVVVMTALVNVLYVVGLYCFVGNSGIVSFGHVAFAAIGAYTVGILTTPVEAKRYLLADLPDLLRLTTLADPVAFLVAGLLAGAVAAVFGFAIMRLKGIGAGIVTLSFLVITNEFLNNWRALGNGGTVTRIPTRTSVAELLVAAVAGLVVAYLFQTSRTGLRLRAARDEENAARSLGIGVTIERTSAFALGAVIMAVAGGFSARLTGSISPGAFFLNLTFLTLAMLVVGGMRSLAGALVGAVLVSILDESLRLTESTIAGGGGVVGWRDIALAAVLITILIARPDGLTRGREISWRRRAPRDAAQVGQLASTRHGGPIDAA